MWRIHVKDALTDWYQRALNWQGVLDVLATLPGHVTGDVTIEYMPD